MTFTHLSRDSPSSQREIENSKFNTGHKSLIKELTNLKMQGRKLQIINLNCLNLLITGFYEHSGRLEIQQVFKYWQFKRALKFLDQKMLLLYYLSLKFVFLSWYSLRKGIFCEPKIQRNWRKSDLGPNEPLQGRKISRALHTTSGAQDFTKTPCRPRGNHFFSCVFKGLATSSWVPACIILIRIKSLLFNQNGQFFYWDLTL